ncbi:MAG: hypothetical protein ACREJD_14250 [Phycisphaerales bacterium]
MYRERALALMLLLMGVAPSLCGCSDSAQSSKSLSVRRTIGEVGISPGQFAFPRCLDSDHRSLWVIDKAARVQRLDPDSGRPLSGWRMPEFAAGKPTGICVFDPTGNDTDELIFVPDTHYHRVMAYKPGADGTTENTPVANFGAYGTGPGQFIYLTDVAVLPKADGRTVARLYVSEYGGNDRISIFEPNPAGEFVFVRSFGEFGDSADPKKIQFSRPQSMDIDVARHRLIITDACNHRIGVFTLEGELIRWIPGANSLTADQTELHDHSELFRYPYGLVLLRDGSALISEQGAARISRIDLESGKILDRTGRPGRGDGELITPWGVTVHNADAFALDSGNNRVLCFPAPLERLTSAPQVAAAAIPASAHAPRASEGQP